MIKREKSRTVLVVEVGDVRRDLVALVTDQSQGIDSIDEVVLLLSLREPDALRKGRRDMRM